MLIITVALAAAIVVVLLALIVIIIYQRWRIGDQNVFIERFIRQNEEQREKLKRAGIIYTSSDVTLDWTRTHLIKEGKMSYSYMIDSSYFPMWDYHFSGDL